MSNTRTAAADAPFRQERFASSSMYGPGLLGNLVAKRCKAIRDVEDRALIYWLQAQSHLEGGLQLFAERFLAAFPEQMGTRTMRQSGKGPGKIYTTEESQAISHEMGHALDDYWLLMRDSEEPPPRPPMTVDDAHRFCQEKSEGLHVLLRGVCLNPKVNLDTLRGENRGGHRYGNCEDNPSAWWFYDLIGALHEYRRQHAEKARQSIAKTMISEMICEDLDYAAQIPGKFVLIEGEQRTGKSTAAKAWCAMHPGKAVYVPLESGRDVFTFYRCIARAIGTASSGQIKSVEMRMKIEDMLQERHLTNCNRLLDTLPAPLTRRASTNAPTVSEAGHEAGRTASVHRGGCLGITVRTKNRRYQAAAKKALRTGTVEVWLRRFELRAPDWEKLSANYQR